MDNTLTYKDTIQRVGYTEINGVKIVQYTCILPVDKPQEMRIGLTKLDSEKYKIYRDECRSDYAKFEDAAYVLQEKCIASLNG
jgi:hypothetical protein